MSERSVAMVDGPASELSVWLAAQAAGSLRPIGVDVHRDQDSSGVESWYFTIVLADPAAGSDTWDAQDLDELQRRTRDKALELQLDWPWYLRFRPETDTEPEEPSEPDS